MTTKTNQKDGDNTVLTKFHNELDNNFDISITDAKKIKAFIKWGSINSGNNPLLMIAIISQFGAEDFLTFAEDIARHGIMGPFDGFNHHSNIESFYANNKASIISWATELYEQRCDLEGVEAEKSLAAFVSKFRSVQKQDFEIDEIEAFLNTDDNEIPNIVFFANSMTRAVAEEVCEKYSIFLEEYEEDSE